jgi:hypothetical protein
MNARTAAALVACAALAAACSTDARPVAATPADPVAPVPEVRDRGGAWTADPRWTARVGELEAASAAAAGRLGPDTGLTFETGHEAIVVFDESAPVEGDVAPRFADGVRRPIIRVRPRALLSGEFVPAVDLAPLVMEGAIAMTAGDREPPAWIVRGVAVVAGDAFDATLHRRALSGDEVRIREDELFGAPATDRLAAAARAKALARCARSERPFARLLQALNAGRTEEAALAAIGIGSVAFLDAAADTERSRAARSLSNDPIVPLVRAARTALAAGDVGRADAALAPFAGVFDDPALDAWVVADARLCLAEIAFVRGETPKAKAALDAAVASSRIVRVRQARVLGVCVASAEARPALLHDLVADWPDAATTGRSAELLKTR